MKSLVRKIATILAVASSVTLLHAQARTAVFGRTEIQFSQNFTSFVGALGGSLSDLNLVTLPSSNLILPVTAGAFNPTTAIGEVEHASGFTICGGGKAIRLENLTVDTTNGMAPVVTAVFVFNNTVLGRMPLFNVQYPSGVTLPLQTNAGVLQVSGLKLSLAPIAAASLNSIFGITAIPAGLNAGTASVYVVFAPLPGGAL